MDTGKGNKMIKHLSIIVFVLLFLLIGWKVNADTRKFLPNTGLTAYTRDDHTRLFDPLDQADDIRWDITYKGSFPNMPSGDPADSCPANFGDITKILIGMRAKYDNQPSGDSQHFFYDIWLGTGPHYLKDGENAYCNRKGDFFALANGGFGDWYYDDTLVFDSLPPGRYSVKIDLYAVLDETDIPTSDLEIEVVTFVSDDGIEGTADSLSPNGAGTNTNFTDESSCGTNYLCVDDPPGSHDGGTTELSKAFTPGGGVPETYTMEDFNSNHIGSDVWRIELYSVANDVTDDDDVFYRNIILLGATEEASEQNEAHKSYVVPYKDILYFPGNPDSGLWSPGDIDSLELGLRAHVPLFKEGRFTQVYGIVTYGNSGFGPIVLDAYGDEDNATTNYNDTVLKVNGTVDHKKYAYLDFDLTGIGKPVGDTASGDNDYAQDSIYLKSCSLSLVRKTPSTAQQLFLAPLSTAFVEGQATWTVYSTGNSWTTGGGDFDSCSAAWCDSLTDEGSADADQFIGLLSTDTTSGLLKLVHDSMGSHLYLLVATDYTTGDFEFYSSEYSNTQWRPTLYLRWGMIGQGYLGDPVSAPIANAIHGPSGVEVIHSIEGTSNVHGP